MFQLCIAKAVGGSTGTSAKFNVLFHRQPNNVSISTRFRVPATVLLPSFPRCCYNGPDDNHSPDEVCLVGSTFYNITAYKSDTEAGGMKRPNEALAEDDSNTAATAAL